MGPPASGRSPRLTLARHRLERIAAAVRSGDSYGVLLGLLTAMLFVSGLGDRLVIRLVGGGLVVLASGVVRHTDDHPRQRAAWWMLVALGIAGLALEPAGDASSSAVAASTFAVLLAALTFRVLGRVVRIRTVDLHALSGALSVYLLIGFTFGWALRALSLLSDAQALSSDPGTDFIYASFITLTTVGFGDIVPLTATARRLIIVEALIGQIFLATVVARFVSLFRLEQDDP